MSIAVKNIDMSSCYHVIVQSDQEVRKGKQVLYYVFELPKIPLNNISIFLLNGMHQFIRSSKSSL